MAGIPLTENEKGRNVVIVLTVFLGLDYFFVFIRFWARHLRSRALEFNDWALLTALFSTTAMYCTIISAVHFGGVGLHVPYIITNWGGMDTIFTAGKLVLAADILWNLSTLTIKMSILHLYISIFSLTSPRFRKTVWTVMGVCVVSTAVFIIQILVLCRPLAYFWDKSIVGGKCGSLNLTYLISSIIITIQDIVTFILPMPILWKLQIVTKKKIAVMLVFGVGLGICLISGVRVKFVIDIKTEDFTATIWMFAIFGGLEPMLGIISACLPIVPVVVAHYTNNRIMAWGTEGGHSGVSKRSGSMGKAINSASGHSERSEFERLGDHEYPLIERQKREVSIDARELDGVSSVQSNTTRPTTIQVTREYTVGSHARRHF